MRMSPASAHDVAAELRRLLPGVATKKLHKLLYYCQGHHLAHFEEPLFTEPVMAWDMGPVVAKVWKVENDQLPAPEPEALASGQLNTVAYVVSRYGRLTGHDLELLTHAEAPWRRADEARSAGASVRIEQEWISSFFASEGGPDADLPWPSSADIARLADGAAERRSTQAREDDLAVLHARLLVR